MIFPLLTILAGAAYIGERERRLEAEANDLKRQKQCQEALERNAKLIELVLELPPLQLVNETLGQVVLTELDSNLRLVLMGAISIAEFECRLQALLSAAHDYGCAEAELPEQFDAESKLND